MPPARPLSTSRCKALHPELGETAPRTASLCRGRRIKTVSPPGTPVADGVVGGYLLPQTFDTVAVELFFRRAVRDHFALRALGFICVAFELLYLRLAPLAVVLAWSLCLMGAEAGVRLWWAVSPSRRAPTSRDALRARRQLMVWGAVLSMLYVAPAFLAMAKGPVGAAVGLTLSSAVVLVVCAQHNLSRLMFFSSGLVPSIALTLSLVSLAPDQAWVLLLMSGALLVNAQNLHASNAQTFRDLVNSRLEADRANTQLRAALDAAEAGSRAKSTFLATMSHEIRTPLNGVLGLADALSRADLDPESAQAVAVIRRSGRSLLTLLNDVLDLAKIEAGQLDLAPQPFCLAKMLSDVAQLFTPSADEKSVALIVEAADAPGLYLGDPARIRQVVSNLISNAVKFTAAGEVRITARRVGDRGVEISVADSGIGISPAQQEALFARFTQVDGSITRRYGGTGLGLAISRELCELMGGEINVRSREGEGAVFTVTLPLAYAGEIEAEADSVAGEGLSRRLKVLCAEDNPTNQFVMRTLLSHLDCTFEICGDGAEAVAAWAAADWDVILMDMQMPVMDGISATRVIRERERAGGRPRTPIVAVTADALESQVALQRDAGADFHLAKPIAAEALVETLVAAAELGESLHRAA